MKGLLYPALHRLEREGLLRPEWRTAESGRRRKYYVLAGEGWAAAASAVVEGRPHLRKLLTRAE